MDGEVLWKMNCIASWFLSFQRGFQSGVDVFPQKNLFFYCFLTDKTANNNLIAGIL